MALIYSWTSNIRLLKEGAQRNPLDKYPYDIHPRIHNLDDVSEMIYEELSALNSVITTVVASALWQTSTGLHSLNTIWNETHGGSAGGNYAFAFGQSSQADATFSIAGGNDSDVGLSAAHSIALGDSHQVEGDHSVAIGGFRHIIISKSEYTGIFAGYENIIEGGSVYSVIIGGRYITATQTNMVYVPALMLASGTVPAIPEEGTLYFDSTTKHFMGYDGTAWKQLDN